MENDCSTLNAALLTTKVTSMRRLISQLCGCGFRKHIKSQLKRAHIISEVFFPESLQILILSGAHSRPGSCNFISHTPLAICSFQSQLLTICKQLISTLIF